MVKTHPLFSTSFESFKVILLVLVICVIYIVGYCRLSQPGNSEVENFKIKKVRFTRH
jgi:hypothetical protein